MMISLRPLRTPVLLLLLCCACGWGHAAHADQLTFGMSAAFTGPTRGLGIEYYRGAMAYLNYVNSQGGVNGHTFALKVYDDGYNPVPCVRNTIRLVESDEIFALFNYVGTPTTTRILPVLKKYEDRSIYLLFPFTGAEPLRSPPYGKYVFNLRASYLNETRGLVDHFERIGRKRIAVFYQADAYGRNGWDGVRQGLEAHGMAMVGEAAYKRGAVFGDDYTEQVSLIAASRPDAVIMVGSYAACAGFVRDARNHGLDVPIASVSFSDPDSILELLEKLPRTGGRDYEADLVFSNVIPSYEDLSLPAVRLYRKLMDGPVSMPPGEMVGKDYRLHQYGAVSFEGFLNSMLLVEMVKHLGLTPQREMIPQAMCALDGLDIGLGVPVSFSPVSHQGLSMVYYAAVQNGRLVPIRDWQRWAK